MADIFNIFLKPIDTLEKKISKSWKKVLIILGIMLGAVLLTGLFASMFDEVVTKDWKGKLSIRFDYLQNLAYVRFIFDFIFTQIIVLGSTFGGIVVYSLITKKKINILKIASIVVVSLFAYYLVESLLNLVFMFDFVKDFKFAYTISSILISIANFYSIVILVFGVQRLYGIESNDKSIIHLLILAASMYAVRYILDFAIMDNMLPNIYKGLVKNVDFLKKVIGGTRIGF